MYFILFLFIFIIQWLFIISILPSGKVFIKNKNKVFSSIYCSPSSDYGWGKQLPKYATLSKFVHNNIHFQPLITLPKDKNNKINRGCTNELLSINHSLPSSFHLLLERGDCSFYEKALFAQRYGASSLIIANTKESIYKSDINTTQLNTTYSFAYDCNKGEDEIPLLNYPIWTSDSNICNRSNRCLSNKCIFTKNKFISIYKNGYQVCCMWDTYQIMGVKNKTKAKIDIMIPVVFITVHDGEILYDLLSNNNNTIYIQLSKRLSDIHFNIASFFIWLMGISTAIGGTYYSASKERNNMESNVLHRINTNNTNNRNSRKSQYDDNDDFLDLTLYHVIGFIIIACLFLIILYYIHITSILSLMYSISAIGPISLLIIHPILLYLLPNNIKTWSFNVSFVDTRISVIECISLMISSFLSIFWYINRRDIDGLWILQDIFGISLTITFLSTIRLPNIKVATVLLSLAFLYDIFFVFITPILFGKSIMMAVATGGDGPETKDDYPGIDYCERYPMDIKCRKPETLPMLLLFPRFTDYRGGFSILGLGDIVIPGLLLVYAIRYDYIKRNTLKDGYFIILSCGYAIGLMIANLAVYIMKTGQPALLYLVPCTLGILIIIAKQRKELDSMWKTNLEVSYNYNNINGETGLNEDIHNDESYGTGNYSLGEMEQYSKEDTIDNEPFIQKEIKYTS